MANVITAASGGSEAQHPLAPYFPRLVIDWIASTPDERHREQVGTVAFVDISGFTKLSEGLARHGKVGAEELTATIGTCFVTLLDLAVGYGGRLLKFGGDALLLFFSGDAHEARACRAAIEMRRALREVGRMTVLGQRVALRMSVGVHSGPFNFFLVGESHREFIVAGPAASTVVTMEGNADAGEIALSPSTAAALRPSVLGVAKGPGFLLRRAPAVPEDSFRPFELVPDEVDLILGVPVGLREALITEHPESEHRRVTVAFVHFDGTDEMIQREGPGVTADRLHRLVTITQRAVDRQEVTFLGTDTDRDGGKIILTAGAPATSGEDEHRMLLAVREIMDATAPLPIRIGVNRGSVFVGEVGPPYRRTFTVMGDAVNLAARLMAKAETGQILSTPELLARSRSRFETMDLEPFFVKGKSRPVQAQAVGTHLGARTVGATAELPLLGREVEMQQLAELATSAAAGHGSVVEIVGETGSGKSRLVSALRQIASDRMQLSAVCERYDSSTPYHEVRRLLRSLLDLPSEGGDEAVGSRLLAALGDRAPELLAWAPLIASAIGVIVPETPESRDLEEEFRRRRLARVVIDLLAKVLPDIGLFVIEDAHNMDEASADLFGRLAAAVGATSWLWCVTRSDIDTGLALEGSTNRIELQPLSEGAAWEVARAATEDAPLTERELSLLIARSGGNPLFLRELIAATLNGDDVESLPESIEEVTAARIDRLPVDARRLLRRMSVLGQSFPVDLLAEVVDDLPGSDDPTWEQLEEFVIRDDTGILSFRDSLLRDSAYGGLTFQLRRQLHSRAADTIRRRSAAGHEEQPELLSFHYLHSQRFGEAWEFSLRAADRAVAVYANSEAAEFYERAISAARRLPNLTSGQVAALHEAMGDARNRSGEYTAAASAYRSARRLIGNDQVSQARLMLKLARVQGWLDRYGNALRWISRGLRVLEGSTGLDADRQRAELMAWYGRFCQEEGHHRRAVRWCTLAVEAAESVGDKAVLADALRVMDWAAMDLGEFDRPDNTERALALFEELGDLPGMAGALNMLGGLAYWKGDWEQASALYLRAQATVHRTGNAVMDAFYVFNLGEIARDQGHLDEAEGALTSALRTWRAAGYRSGTGYAKGMLARVATWQHRYGDARRFFDEAIEELSDIGSRDELLWVQVGLAEWLLLSGDTAGALSLADKMISQAHALGGMAPQIPAFHRVRGAALALAGDSDGARQALRQSLRAAEMREVEYEAALTMRVLAAVENDPREQELLARSAAQIFGKLKVDWTPDLLSAQVARPAESSSRSEA